MPSTRILPATPGVPAAEPAWDVAYQFPEQGTWTEQEYLQYITKRGYELCDGRLEMLPMPTEEHQIIAAFLFQALSSFANSRNLGLVLFAGLRVHTLRDKVREPDIVYLNVKNASRRGNKMWEGADLVMEIVSADDPDRDYRVKRDEYAKAGIREYWIVDPAKARVMVLKLEDQAYGVHGEFGLGSKATSALLDGFSVDVTAALTVK